MSKIQINKNQNSSLWVGLIGLASLALMVSSCSDDHGHGPETAEDPAEHACIHLKESSGINKKITSGNQLFGDDKSSAGLWEFAHLRYDIQLTGSNPYMGSAWFETHEEGEILLFSASIEVPVLRTLPDSLVVIPDTIISAPSSCSEMKFYSIYDLPKGKVSIEWKNSAEATAKIVLEEGGDHAHAHAH